MLGLTQSCVPTAKNRLALFLLGFFISVGVLAIGGGTSSAASHSKTQVRIVPLECVIEEIHNGITETHFLEPAECEEKLNPLSPLPPSSPEDVLLRPLTNEDRNNGAFDSLPTIKEPGKLRPELQSEPVLLGRVLETRPLIKSINILFQFSIGTLLLLPALLVLAKFGIAYLIRR